jgi:hypothetical protein
MRRLAMEPPQYAPGISTIRLPPRNKLQSELLPTRLPVEDCSPQRLAGVRRLSAAPAHARNDGPKKLWEILFPAHVSLSIRMAQAYRNGE